ncbi:nitrogenase-stabilizing/protective protein NifW, partial [Frankia sp. EI5c]|uniref:nitrogenase-stabilizing/protective protein NifW n=1 Tax=Frankia sp. EI5c TaxID=683316 RepID=UPI001F5B66E4
MSASASQLAERLAEFRRCSTAEQYFDLLGVDYDPRVVAVNRLHILRYFAGEIANLHG